MEILLDKRPERRIFNVGNPERVTVNGWVKRCYGVLNKRPVCVYVDGNIPQRSYFPFYDYDYTLDITAMSGLMPEVKSLDEGLRQSYEWYAVSRDLIVRKPLLKFIADNL